jgi:hypothetical protein
VNGRKHRDHLGKPIEFEEKKYFINFACARSKEGYVVALSNPVKRSIFLCSSSILLGALVALVLHAVRPNPGGPQRGAKLFGRLSTDAFAWFQLAEPAAEPPLPAPPPPVLDLGLKSIGVVVLAEPIVILYDNQFNGREIPRGTRMEVLRDNGKYLEVRFGPDVVTILRTATVGNKILVTEG